MRVNNVNQNNNTVFCGYNSKLKKMYRQGKLPKNLVDMGGNKLNQENLSLDHIQPHSKGGPTTEDNLVLTTKKFNSLRGDRHILEVVTKENLIKWVKQYLSLESIDGFDFRKYVIGVLNRMDK